MKGYVDRCIAGAQALGQDYITWPLLDAPDRTIEPVQGHRATAQCHRDADQESRASARIPQSRLRVRRAERSDWIRHHPERHRTLPSSSCRWICTGSPAGQSSARTNGSSERQAASRCGTSRTCTKSVATTRSLEIVRLTSPRIWPDAEARRLETLLRRAGRQLHPRSVSEHHRQRCLHEARDAEVANIESEQDIGRAHRGLSSARRRRGPHRRSTADCRRSDEHCGIPRRNRTRLALPASHHELHRIRALVRQRLSFRPLPAARRRWLLR